MIDRRRLMFGLAGVTGTLATLPALAHPGIDWDDDADRLRATMMMRGSLDERVCAGWVIGARYAVLDHVARPFVRILAGTFSQCKQVRDDAYEVTALEVAYFLDYNTWELLDEWTNPYTGIDVRIPQVRMGPSKVLVTADKLEIMSAAGEAVGLELNHRFERPVVRGDDVWLTEIISVDGQPPMPNARRFVYNEMSTYHSKLSELEHPDTVSAPTTVEFHNLVTFRPWMGFGDQDGHTTAHASGARAARIEDMPAQYLELTQKHHPDVLDDPLGALSGKKT